MIEAISTGKNRCYGEKNKLTRFSNVHLEFALREGYIKPETIKFIPLWTDKKKTVQEKIKPHLLPEKKVYIHNKVNVMDGNIKRILEIIKEVVKRQKELKKLLNELK